MTTTTAEQRTITGTLREVLLEHGKEAPESMTDETPLVAGGLDLDSLEFAVLVVKLEDVFDFDPFAQGLQGPFPTTIGELAKLYNGRPGG